MRLVYFHQYFATPQMSGGVRSYEFARRLVARGHTVDLITSDRTSRFRGWRITYEDGIRVHWCSVPYDNAMGPARRIAAFLKFAVLAAIRGARIRCDLVFATSTPLTICLPAVFAARWRRVPLVFEVRDLWPEVPIALGVLRGKLMIRVARALERFAYRNSAHVIALSPQMRDGVVATGYRADRVTVVPNAADCETFTTRTAARSAFRSQRSWLGDRPLVVYTGTLGRVNGVDYIARLAAAALERDQDIRFLIVGSGAERTRIAQTARLLGVLDVNFFMEPPVPRAAVPQILAAATLSISTVINVPELWKNSANKVFDTLAAGRPVVINHDGWIADVIRSNRCGLVLHATDLAAAATALASAVRDAPWLAAAGAQAAQVARREFDRDLLAARFERALLEALPAAAGAVALTSAAQASA